MVAPLDIFRDRVEPEWIGWAETLEQALDLMREGGPDSYFVFSQQRERKNYYHVNADGVISPLAMKTSLTP